MLWALIAAVVIAVVIALIFAARKNSSSTGGTADLPYVKQETLITAAERSFLGVLEQAVGDRFRIYAQVRLADLLSVRPGTEKSQRTTAQNKINSKHADFVLCDRQTLEILCAIELDDSSHQRESRKARDAFMEEACVSAGLPLARFPAKSAYPVNEVRHSIFSLLGIIENESPVEKKGMDIAVSKESIPSVPKAPPCPKCNGETVLRTVKSGARAGSKLWGCRNYPACKGYVPAGT
jgi:very-short-patch-repair endonuclease